MRSMWVPLLYMGDTPLVSSYNIILIIHQKKEECIWCGAILIVPSLHPVQEHEERKGNVDCREYGSSALIRPSQCELGLLKEPN